jgi:hypothetical protein
VGAKMPSYLEIAARLNYKLPPVVEVKEVLGTHWNGFCPACRYPGPMLLNTDGHWECGGCQIQVSTTPDIHVLAEKGSKNFEQGQNGTISTVDKEREIPFGKVQRDLRKKV